MRLILVILVQILLYVRGKSDPEGKKYVREEYHNNKRRQYLLAESMPLPNKYHGNKGKHYLLEVAMNRTLQDSVTGRCGEVCTEINGRKDCEAVCEGGKHGKYFRKVYVGVVMPEVGPTGANEFNLCQGSKCVKGGRVGSFGGTKEDTEIQSNEVVDDKKFKIVEVDVTDVIVKEGWSFKEPMEAKMTSTVASNLPAPVVIIKKLDKGGNVISNQVKFSPNEKRKRYGNLLDKYSSNDEKKNKKIILE